MKKILFLALSLNGMVKKFEQVKCPECSSVFIHIDNMEIGTPEPVRKMRERRKQAVIAATATILTAAITATVTITTNIYGCKNP